MMAPMELTDRVAVVTGAASGIGRALAWRLAEEGARGVVVADLDASGAQAVASDIGARALGVGCDVADEQQVVDLVARAQDAFGPVDLFCANAGVAVGTDLDTPEETWELALGVNVRAHLYAAKALVPGWLERGEGDSLATAPAAGLLTQIGAAPYAVTKHAAVAFAEWLAVTYGDRGLRVSCLCPMGVATPLFEAGLDEPGPGGTASTPAARLLGAAPGGAGAGGAGEPRRGRRGRGARAGRRGRDRRRGAGRRALPHPPPPRGARVPAPQDQRLRPLAGRDAAPAAQRHGCVRASAAARWPPWSWS